MNRKMEVKCECCGSKSPAYQNEKTGEYLWLFNWKGGGFNDVWAKTKEEAIKKANAECSLKVDESTIRTCTYQQYEAQNRMGWMMSI